MASHCSRIRQMYNRMREKLAAETEDEDPDVKCTFCVKTERLMSFNGIKRGDHIKMGGLKGMHNIGKRQRSLYTHHAIVKDIEIIDSSSANLTLIHFISIPYDETLEIRQTTECKNLTYDEIYVVKYRHKTHPAEKIIKRAESLITNNVKYSGFSCNCEHFCHWCCVSSDESVQIDNLKYMIFEVLTDAAHIGNVGAKILRIALKLVLYSLDDLSGIAKTSMIAVPWGVLSGVLLVSLIFSIYSHTKLSKKLKEGTICSACCRCQKNNIWGRFAVLNLTQAGGLGLLSLIMAVGASGGVAVGVMVLVGVLTLVLTWAVPKLKQKFCSPFKGKLIKVKSMKSIWIGDVISYDHWKMLHDGIVSAVQTYPGTNDMKGEIKVIHYSLPQLFGRRKIMEDVIDVDLNKDSIKGHDYSGYTVHEPEIVVKRARQRIGETKFGMMSNRSSHFCHWAKLNEDIDDEPLLQQQDQQLMMYDREINLMETLSKFPEINIDHRIGRNQATNKVCVVPAYIREEVKVGQIIEFKYNHLPHKAVTTHVDISHRCVSKVSVTVVHYGSKRVVTEETFAFNLNYKHLKIHKYHPLCRYKKEDVIKRARSRIGERKYKIFTNRSSHLAEEIVEKNKDTLVSDIDEIHPGDGISFYYWSLKHDAIVTKVQKVQSKANDKGSVTIVHYALGHLFAKRTITEEVIHMDLARDNVYVKCYTGFVTYPEEIVVQRAKTRVEEQRFCPLNNNSSDFVHWTKVVQTPVLVAGPTVTVDKLQDDDDMGKRLLVPNIGKQYEKFQRVQAHTWSDLVPGTIVEYRYYWIWHQGILTVSSEKGSYIRVIHYGTNHIFAKRSIREDKMTVNLKRDKLWIYRCHPKECNKQPIILQKAMLRLDEKEWGRHNRSWDFCKDCVLKSVPEV